MAWTQRDKDSSERLLSLAEIASDLKIDPQIPIRRYYRSGSEMLKMGEIYYKENKLESAYILFFKYVTLHIDKIKKHPDYKDVLRLLPEEMKKVNGQVKVILLELEKIKSELRKIYEAEHKVWTNEMVQKWRSVGEVKKESGEEVKNASRGDEENKSGGEVKIESGGEEEKKSGGVEKKEIGGKEEKESEGEEEKESGGEEERVSGGEEEKENGGEEEKEKDFVEEEEKCFEEEEEKVFVGEVSQSKIPNKAVKRQADISVFKNLSFHDLKKWFRHSEG